VAAVEQRIELFTGSAASSLIGLSAALTECRACPRLVAWREEVAVTKRAAFIDDDYWGRPVPGFGDPDARIAIIGLAPAAHGANRTGRMFTGDRSGEWLYRALHTAGLANQPTSTDRDDGLALSDVWITAPVRCAPPKNKPTPAEKENCSVWFDAELALLENVAVYVVLGQIAYHSLWAHLARKGAELPKPRPKFGLGNEVIVDDKAIVMSYHVSQQNTFTGKLTESMLDDVFARALVFSTAVRPPA
jgi:uracil-DNA glycosylase family 4